MCGEKFNIILRDYKLSMDHANEMICLKIYSYIGDIIFTYSAFLNAANLMNCNGSFQVSSYLNDI